MSDTTISLKPILYAVLVSLLIVAITFFIQKYDNKTTVVFCDVGQGDGTYIRIRNTFDVVIDGGPSNSLLRCLGKYMPFYDRTIELAIITHPQKDHYFGFLDTINRYSVQTLALSRLDSTNVSFKKLLQDVKKTNTSVIFPLENTEIVINNATLTFYWPTMEYLSSEFDSFELDAVKLYPSSTDPNMFSLVFLYEQDDFRIFFPGDAPNEILKELAEQADIKTTILKFPHHGSKLSLNHEFLELADPFFTVISSGKNNNHGHPAPEVIEWLEENNKAYGRTDLEGDIVFKVKDSYMKRYR